VSIRPELSANRLVTAVDWSTTLTVHGRASLRPCSGRTIGPNTVGASASSVSRV
jgi:hypothetical protein